MIAEWWRTKVLDSGTSKVSFRSQPYPYAVWFCCAIEPHRYAYFLHKHRIAHYASIQDQRYAVLDPACFQKIFNIPGMMPKRFAP